MRTLSCARFRAALFSGLMGLFAALACGCGEPASPAGLDRGSACARISACADLREPLLSGDVTGFAACSSALRGFGVETGAGRVVRCVEEAVDCETVRSCLHLASTPDCGATFLPECQGDVLIGCFAGQRQYRDCTAEGLRCLDDACVEPGPCERDRCEGQTHFACALDGSRATPIACEGECLEDEGRFARCVPSFEPCTPDDNRCDGDVAHFCQGGFMRRTRCLPGQCRDTDGAFCANGSPCVSRCAGSVLMGCLDDGVQEPFDCADWGSGTCIEDEEGVRCAP